MPGLSPTLLRAATMLAAVAACLLAPPAAAQDRAMMQGFYWDGPPNGVWYDSLATRAAHLGWAGFDGIWLPPMSKGAAGPWDVGYTPYDYYDLGSYDSCAGDNAQGQGGCLSTRYGTEAGLREAVATLRARGLEVYADIVLNHRSGGLLEDNAYGAYFTWDGGSLYSVGGRTYTAFPLTRGSGRIAWPVGGGNEFFYPNAANNPGNTGDFYSESQLAGFHRLYTNSFGYDNALHDGFGAPLPLGDSLMVWGDWLTQELGLDGYRFDFVKGIHPAYLKAWVDFGAMRGKFHVHELYDGDLGRLSTYHSQLYGSERAPAVFDFNLRFAYKAVLDGGAPVHTWHTAGLHNQLGFPTDDIVTFVDNHDFDRTNYEGEAAQADHNPIVSNKMLAYAHMLTHPGYATVWWRDYHHYGLGPDIAALLRIRKAFASGPYYALTRGDIGAPFWPGSNPPDPWNHLYVAQRTGSAPGRGLIVAINTHPTQWAEVWVTQQNGAWTGETLKDLTGHAGGGTTEVFGDGRVRVWAPPASYTVWVPQSATLPDPGPEPAADTPAYHRLDFGAFQWPSDSTTAPGATTTAYARAYVHGRTNHPGAAAGLSAWIGISQSPTDPAMWTTWIPAPSLGDSGHLDEFAADLTLPLGTYYLAARFQLDGGPFAYGGFSASGGGFFHAERAPHAVLRVRPPGTHDVSGTVALGARPLRNVRVTLDDGASEPLAALSRADGSFTVEGVPDGTYDVTARATGYEIAPTSVVVSGADVSGLALAAERARPSGTVVQAAPPQPHTESVAVRAPLDALGGALPSGARWLWGDGASSPAVLSADASEATGQHAYAPGVYDLRLDGAGLPDAPHAVVSVFDAAVPSAALSGHVRTEAGDVHLGFLAPRDGGAGAQLRVAAGGLDVRADDATLHTAPAGALHATGHAVAAPEGRALRYRLLAHAGSGLAAPPRVRLTLWDDTTGALVYDLQPGDPDEAAPSALLEGGEVVLWTPLASDAAPGADEQPLAITSVFPNPARGALRVRYRVPTAGAVRVELVDLLGRTVRVLADAEAAAGEAEVIVETGGVAPGLYLVRLRTDHGAATHRLTLLP